MASSIFHFLLLLLAVLCGGFVQSHEDGHIAAEISNKGLDFLTDLLIEKAESSLVPLELPAIEKTVKIPVLGKVKMVLSDITIDKIHTTSSAVKIVDSEIAIDVSGATADLSMSWKYSYSNSWLIPISISDAGNATVQVEGLEVGLSLSLNTFKGSLNLSLLECGCHVNNISIKLDGGASWLYQGLVDAFEGKIGSSVESAVSKKIKNAIVKLDSLLQSLPHEFPVTEIATLNVTLVDDPVFSDSSVDLRIDGLISAKNEVGLTTHKLRFLKDTYTCKEAEKMVRILLHEAVLQSASSVYFEASKMHWKIDKAPNQSLMNTAGWRFIVPQLYKMYPNHDLNLNLSVSANPTVKVEKQQIMAQIPLDVVIDVLDGEEVVPVACISTVICASVFAEISQNTVAGALKLMSFTMSLKWSNIGGFHMHLIQTIMSTTLRTVVVPYINLKLGKGFPIPSFHGCKLQDAQVVCSDSWLVICSNMAPITNGLSGGVPIN